MLKEFYREVGGVYRLKIPFDDLYTSVFLLDSKEGFVLIDSGTYDSDVDEWILPALNTFGISLKKIKHLIITHEHSDHSGGLKRILELFPDIKVIDKEQAFKLGDMSIYPLKGHTKNLIGILDESSGTLISGDGLQGDGVGKYRFFVESLQDYVQTIEKIEKDERIKNVLFSHDYEPWNKNGIYGREKVLDCLKKCKKAYKEDKNESYSD